MLKQTQSANSHLASLSYSLADGHDLTWLAEVLHSKHTKCPTWPPNGVTRPVETSNRDAAKCFSTKVWIQCSILAGNILCGNAGPIANAWCERYKRGRMVDDRAMYDGTVCVTWNQEVQIGKASLWTTMKR